VYWEMHLGSEDSHRREWGSRMLKDGRGGW
jgi:hypothetical protein